MDSKARTGLIAGLTISGVFSVLILVIVIASRARNDPAASSSPVPGKSGHARPGETDYVTDSRSAKPKTDAPAASGARSDESDSKETVPEPPTPQVVRPSRPALPDLRAGGMRPTQGVEKTQPPPQFSKEQDVPAVSDPTAPSRSRPSEDTSESNKQPTLNAVDQAYVDRLNAFRKLAKQQPVIVDTALSEGCVAHANYLVMHFGEPVTAGLGVHDEKPGISGYSKEGAAAARASVITGFGASLPRLPDRGWPITALDLWMSTLYHRVPMLNPALKRVGIGYIRNERMTIWHVVMDVNSGVDRDPANARERNWPIVYPGDVQTDVPRRFGWGTEEIPNPLPEGRKADASGYPITASFPRTARVKDVSATLVQEPDPKASDGKPEDTPFWLSTPEHPASSAEQQNTICLIPVNRLKVSTVYNVTMRAKVDGRNWQKSWHFTTGKMK